MSIDIFILHNLIQPSHHIYVDCLFQDGASPFYAYVSTKQIVGTCCTLDVYVRTFSTTCLLIADLSGTHCVCVLDCTAPVVDDCTGGGLGRTATYDEEFLLTWAWRAVPYVHRLRSKSSAGSPCLQHPARCVASTDMNRVFRLDGHFVNGVCFAITVDCNDCWYENMWILFSGFIEVN